MVRYHLVTSSISSTARREFGVPVRDDTLVALSPLRSTGLWTPTVSSTVPDAGRLAAYPSEAAEVSNSIRPSAHQGTPR